VSQPAGKTWQGLLATGADILMQVGVATAKTDARWLLAGALGVARDRLAAVMDEPVKPAELVRFDEFLQRRCAYEPVSQILAVREFFGREFRVTRDVLDPRPETEVLVQIALKEPATSVLDLGTGSGCILLSVLAENLQASGVGTDLSQAALAIAQSNAAALQLEQRCQFLQAKWFAGVTGQFDLIVSNPPYISAAEFADLPPDVANFEPRIALAGGRDGLDAYRAIASDVARYLSPRGRLVVEIGPTQAADVTAMFKAAGLVKIEVHRDLDGRDRVVIGRRLADNS